MEQSKGTKARVLSIGYLSVDAVRDEPFLWAVLLYVQVVMYVVCFVYYDF